MSYEYKEEILLDIGPVTPMSEYWKDMFEWSTRHLRRDA